MPIRIAVHAHGCSRYEITGDVSRGSYERNEGEVAESLMSTVGPRGLGSEEAIRTPFQRLFTKAKGYIGLKKGTSWKREKAVGESERESG